MLIGSVLALDAFTAFNASFEQGLTDSELKDSAEQFAEVTTSTTEAELYPFLRDLPGINKWGGQRLVQALAQQSYRLVNDDFEGTVGVPRNAIDDNLTSTYDGQMQMLGRAVARHPNEQLWEQIKQGTINLCHDGTPFYNNAHPHGKNGAFNFSNDLGGVGGEWYIMCLDEVVKPLIYQKRKAPNFVSLNNETDQNTFLNKEYLFGTDYRAGFGYTFPQLSLRSAQTLDEANFETALQTIANYKTWDGKPMNVRPSMLVCGPSNRSAALNLLKAKLLPNGGSNTNEGALPYMVSAFLT